MSTEIISSVTEGVKDTVENISKKGSSALLAPGNNPTQKSLLDAIQEKIISRKLLVFITATVLMWFGLDPETWGMIAMMYIGGQSAIDMVKTWKWG